MTINGMIKEIKEYCNKYPDCNGCRLMDSEDCCRWNINDPESTEDCYWFLVYEGLIGKPEQPEINFVKVDRNDEIEQTNDAVNHFPDPTQKVENDAVNHPSHYTYGGIECIDAIHAVVNEIPNGICAWLTGQVIKYIWRWFHKDKPVEDLKKCRFYLDRLIENAEVVYGKNT